MVSVPELQHIVEMPPILLVVLFYFYFTFKSCLTSIYNLSVRIDPPDLQWLDTPFAVVWGRLHLAILIQSLSFMTADMGNVSYVLSFLFTPLFFDVSRHSTSWWTTWVWFSIRMTPKSRARRLSRRLLETVWQTVAITPGEYRSSWSVSIFLEDKNDRGGLGRTYQGRVVVVMETCQWGRPQGRKLNPWFLFGCAQPQILVEQFEAVSPEIEQCSIWPPWQHSGLRILPLKA